MLITLSTTRRPATDLGYLLHKHPDRAQSFTLPFGEARVFYPEATEERLLPWSAKALGLIRGSTNASSASSPWRASRSTRASEGSPGDVARGRGRLAPPLSPGRRLVI